MGQALSKKTQWSGAVCSISDTGKKSLNVSLNNAGDMLEFGCGQFMKDLSEIKKKTGNGKNVSLVYSSSNDEGIYKTTSMIIKALER